MNSLRALPNLRGCLNNNEIMYTAARTNGDRSCALHASLGEPQPCPPEHDGGHWYERHDAREYVRSFLPENIVALEGGLLDTSLRELIGTFWQY